MWTRTRVSNAPRCSFTAYGLTAIRLVCPALSEHCDGASRLPVRFGREASRRGHSPTDVEYPFEKVRPHLKSLGSRRRPTADAIGYRSATPPIPGARSQRSDIAHSGSPAALNPASRSRKRVTLTTQPPSSSYSWADRNSTGARLSLPVPDKCVSTRTRSSGASMIRSYVVSKSSNSSIQVRVNWTKPSRPATSPSPAAPTPPLVPPRHSRFEAMSPWATHSSNPAPGSPDGGIDLSAISVTRRTISTFSCDIATPAARRLRGRRPSSDALPIGSPSRSGG